MIKRFGKMKKSKRGSLLIIVVLILALAIIFISSAMMLTQATKSRLYGNAMTSQARLTVTAASEAFLEALETQEITDDQFDRMLLGDDLNHPKVGQQDPGDWIRMYIDGSDTIPGMSATGTDNATFLDLYYPIANNYNIVHADFSTTIGDETENVQIRLVVNDNDSPTGNLGFSNQVEICSSVGVSQMRFSSGVGMYDYDNYKLGSPRDNTIFFRDDFFENESSNSLFFSDIVVGGNPSGTVFCYGSNTGIFGDMVFLDNAYLSTHAGNNWGVHGDLYFIGEPEDNIDDDDISFKLFKDGGWSNIANDINIIFSGRRVQDQGATWAHGTDSSESDNGKIKALVTGTNANRAYFVDKEGKPLAVATVAAKQTNGTSYTVNNTNVTGVVSNTGNYPANSTASTYSVTDKVNYYQNTFKANLGSFRTFTEVAEDLKLDVRTAASDIANIKFVAKSEDGTQTFAKGSTIPAGTKYYIPLSATYPYESTDTANYKTINIASDYATHGSGGYKALAPGYYKILGSGGTPVSTRTQGQDPFVYCIDGSKAEQYRFWFEGNSTFNLINTVFAVYNVDEEDTDKHSAIFVLEDGAKLLLGGTTADQASQNTSDVLCSSGFLSVPRANSAAALSSYINGKNCGGEGVAHKRTATTNWNYKKDNGTDGDDILYNVHYDGKTRPAMFIYGVNNNEFKITFGTILEAYIGIYGNGSFGVQEGTKKGTGEIIPIYGRIEAAYFQNGASGNQPMGNILMPYCPQPYDDGGGAKIRPAVSKYVTTDVIYYYDSPV